MTIFSAFAALFILSSCVSPVYHKGGVAKRQVKITSVALVPLQYEGGKKGDTPKDEGEREVVVRFIYGAILEESASKLSGVDVMSYPQDGDGLFSDSVQSDYPDYKKSALEACGKLGAQAVLMGSIDQFNERQGGEYGITSPAAVTCEVQLLDCRTGALLWEDYFNETQQSLFHNLLDIRKFLERHGKWITARQLAREGVSMVIRDLNRYLEGK